MTSNSTPTAFVGTIVFDLDGVIYLGSTPIAGAAESVVELRRRGWQILFATNNSTKTPESVAAVLSERAGLDVDPGSVFTSGMAAGRVLLEKGLRTVLVVGSRELEATIVGQGAEIVDGGVPDAVVVGLDRSLTYDKIDLASRAIRNGAAFIATNTDSTFPTPNGESPGAGTVVAAIAEASGRAAIACGKPELPMLDLVRGRIGSPRVYMVGDRPETDIAFAKAGGWGSVLTLSGIELDPRAIPAQLRPDHIIQSIADLPGTLEDIPQ